jgi:hypothetical protein
MNARAASTVADGAALAMKREFEARISVRAGPAGISLMLHLAHNS